MVPEKARENEKKSRERASNSFWGPTKLVCADGKKDSEANAMDYSNYDTTGQSGTPNYLIFRQSKS
jgi:hypothetical protein